MIEKVESSEVKTPAGIKVSIQLTKAAPFAVYQQGEKLFFNVRKEKSEKEELAYEALSPTPVALTPKETRKRLQKIVSVDVQYAKAGDVITSLAEDAGLGVMISPAFEWTSLTIKIKGQSLEDALAMIIGRVPGFDYDIQNGTIYVAAPTDLIEQKKIMPKKTEVYLVTNVDIAQQSTRISSQIKPYWGSFLTDIGTNTIILQGTADDLERLKDAMIRLGIFAIPSQTGKVGAGGKTKNVNSEDVESGTIVTRVFELNFPSSNNPMTTEDWNSKNLDRIVGILKSSVLSKTTMAKAVADYRMNSVVVTDVIDKMQEIEAVIKQMDAPLRQVIIEAMLVEVDINKETSLGINWTFSNNTPINPTTAQVTQGTNLAAGGAGGTLTFGSIQSSHTLNATLLALTTDGSANILSTPKIAAMDRTVANFTLEDAIPYQGPPIYQTIGNQVITMPNIQTINLPITLRIRPEIGKDDKTITLNPLQVEVVSATGSAGANLPPPTNTRNASTVVAATDGETVVIGGLVRDSDRKTEFKVPILGDLPLIGFFFKSTTVTKQKIELLVFITPRIVR